MEKKNQIYVAAFIMYLLAGFAGYINQFGNYWIVLILSLLISGFTYTCIIGEEREEIDNRKFYWISTFAFAVCEIILTICIELIKLPFKGVFNYFNYTVQIAGYLFAIYATIRFVLSYTDAIPVIKKLIGSKKKTKAESVSKENKVEEKVKETIKEEPVDEDLDDIDIVGEDNSEPQVIGIEYKKEPEVETPYMEEEI